MLKLNKLKQKLLALLCATSISFSVISVPVSASTSEDEIEFSQAVLNSLPKEGEEGFEKFRPKLDPEKLKEKKVYKVKHRVDTSKSISDDDDKDTEYVEETIEINEKEVYEKIKKEVETIITKVKNQMTYRDEHPNMSPEEENEAIKSGKISPYYKTKGYENTTEQELIAEALYSLVVEKISYDYETYYAIKGILKSGFKPQNALFVFETQQGVCDGKANLIDLVMNIAGIATAHIHTTCYKYNDNDRNGHAYNAVYLNGWKLLDATWGRDDSDMNLMNKRKNIFMEGMLYSLDELEFIFNDCPYVNSDYLDEVKGSLSTIVPKTPESFKSLNDDKDIEDLNAKIKKYLDELNSEFDNIKFKFTEIYLDKSKDLKYKTNLNNSEAEKCKKEKEQKEQSKQINDIYINQNYELFNWLHPEELPTLNEIDNINGLNHTKNKLQESEKYSKALKEFIVNEINDNMENRIFQEKNMAQLNEEIKLYLEKLNKEYSDIIKFESFEIYKDNIKPEEHINTSFCFRTKTTATFEEAKKTFNEKYELKEITKKQQFFPGFYNTKLSLQEANKQILNEDVHKIQTIFFPGHINCNTLNKYKFNPDKNSKVYVEMVGEEENSFLLISSDKNEENCKITSEISKFKIPIQVSYLIKKLTLTGDEEIDISKADNLEQVDLTNSTRYKEGTNGLIYEKGQNGEKDKLITQWKKIDGQKYFLKTNKDGSIDEIEVSGDIESPVECNLTDSLKNLNGIIKIGIGIKKLTLTGDEKIDISTARHLKKVDLKNSTRYKEGTNGLIYEKGQNGKEDKLISQYKNIGELTYSFKTNEDGSVDKIEVAGNFNNLTECTISGDFKNFNKVIHILYGIEKLTLTGDEEIDISKASNLKTIDASKSTRYIVEDNTLYLKDTNGNKGKEIAKFPSPFEFGVG